MMRAFGYILLPVGHSRGQEPVRDIAWADTKELADATVLHYNPHCRIFSRTEFDAEAMEAA